ncbi:hypothetical protein COV81_03100 [Candidatus Peregrinibacteria bacterium CG11_big_fil_rev_8_21_14_0_20_41_10]|nr:MAG: hypothetical protein COV81_03100 [Candidatus Peregrinibacteria bacterium CG11_big_fil_rev_8_21_14_0_20_41_10]PIZ74938.1 MAG: hypothetical protein COY06_03430 [Candidatus Peregrinibacteria bacterium CG_4_10_14_0_2_um_filter_41_8]
MNRIIMYSFYLYLIIIICLDVITALSARQAFESGNLWFLLLAIISLTIAGSVFIKTLSYRSTAIVNVLWIGLATLFVIFASYLAFHEIPTTTQAIGMAIILAGIITMELSTDSATSN